MTLDEIKGRDQAYKSDKKGFCYDGAGNLTGEQDRHGPDAVEDRAKLIEWLDRALPCVNWFAERPEWLGDCDDARALLREIKGDQRNETPSPDAA